MDDLHIRNGYVVDGTGAPGRVADIAVRDGVVTAVGDVDGTARRTVDADGALVTPGFVDIHTHFDGQVCWDKQVTPSSWHGVTTVVMGNCGVGFAPVRPGTEAELVALMEAVEDIPGTALHEGIPWGWESFGQYLDAIDTPYSVDVGAQIPHVALRYYVMGDRCYDDASADDIARMASLSRGALADGALGFSTSRFYGHRNKQGQVVPGTHASADEMVAIAEALRDGGHGTMEISPTTWTSPTSWRGSRPSPASSDGRSRCCRGPRSTAASGSWRTGCAPRAARSVPRSAPVPLRC